MAPTQSWFLERADHVLTDLGAKARGQRKLRDSELIRYRLPKYC